MTGVSQQSAFEVECPHCRKSFAAKPMPGGRAARYRGFKCPHCKLFVPAERADEFGNDDAVGFGFAAQP